MTTATRLSLYNGACEVIGERALVTTTETRETRRALDDVWDRGGVRTCLSSGLWNFARRGIQWNFDPSFTPPFGYRCAFNLPTDWVRWMAVCEDEYMQIPLLRYQDEGSYFFCDLQQIYVAYVSDDIKFGMDMSKWPDNFQRYVEAYFGSRIAWRITNSKETQQKAAQQCATALKKAKSTDAMDEATVFLPAGRWSQARHGRRGNWDRGSRTRLIG